jgi:hypothetical protein
LLASSRCDQAKHADETNDPEKKKKKKNKKTSKDVMDKKKQEFLAACNGSVGKAMDKR